ncbi:hypothetical protein L9F63_016001, partial [Diploptera punctata]
KKVRPIHSSKKRKKRGGCPSSRLPNVSSVFAEAAQSSLPNVTLWLPRLFNEKSDLVYNKSILLVSMNALDPDENNGSGFIAENSG